MLAGFPTARAWLQCSFWWLGIQVTTVRKANSRIITSLKLRHPSHVCSYREMSFGTRQDSSRWLNLSLRQPLALIASTNVSEKNRLLPIW